MARFTIPASIDSAPADAQPLLQQVKAKFGQVPNLYRLVAISPAALAGYLAFNEGLGGGTLPVTLREQIALTVANVNRCSYCNAAHGFIAKNVAKLGEDEIAAARRGTSGDAKADAALRFARRVAVARGGVDADEVAAVRAVGFSEAEVIEIVAHVALNTLTNYVNEVFKTDIDFPVAALADAELEAA